MIMLRYAVVLMFSFLLISTASASDAKEKIQQYFNKTAVKVKAAESAEEKREILNNSFDKMINLLGTAEDRAVNEEDKNGISAFKETIVEKKNELNGNDGFAAVADKDLDRFADYVVQDMEVADRYVTISVGALIIIALLLILLL